MVHDIHANVDYLRQTNIPNQIKHCACARMHGLLLSLQAKTSELSHCLTWDGWKNNEAKEVLHWCQHINK